MKRYCLPIAILLWCAIAVSIVACGDRATLPKAQRVPGPQPSPSNNWGQSWFGPEESAQQQAQRSVSFHSFTQGSLCSQPLPESQALGGQPSLESGQASSGLATTRPSWFLASWPLSVVVCGGIGLGFIALYGLGWLLRRK